MSVKYIPPSKNVGESVHDINDNFETLDKQNTAIAQSVAGKADTTDVQNLAEQLNNKANTSDLETKVSNDQTGATELFDTLGESSTTPGTEDSFIVKSLNQYTRRPFTALLNWIKSNLAKVATSGSYNDLSNKPTIPKAVTVDAELSGTSTNPLQNKIVKAKFDAVDSQISSLGIDNGNLWARVKTKADNTAEGATALLGNLSESNTAPGDEDEVIIKNLNQYTHRPLTKLFDWIKANLAKVATSGSYNDLTNKPDIPTVDSSFSESGTNAVAGNVILSALNSKANKTELQALSNQVSNKADKSKLGTAAAKNVDTTVTSGSANLITSGGVATALKSYRPKIIRNISGNGKYGYWCFAQIKVLSTWADRPIEFKILTRNDYTPCCISVSFIAASNTDPDIRNISMFGVIKEIYAYKSDASTWQLYVKKNQIWEDVTVASVDYVPNYFEITFPGIHVDTKHTSSTSNPVVGAGLGYRVGTANNANTWNGLTDDTMTANTTDTRLMVLNGNKVQHRQIDTLPFLSSDDLAQPALYTSTTTTTSATITGLFYYSLIWLQVVGSKTTHTHILPLAYLKSKGSLTFKDSGTPINILYVSDTQIRWFEYQGSGAETYSSATIVKIL